jgi:hypothetical protein
MNKILIIKSFWKFLSLTQKITFVISFVFSGIFLYTLFHNDFNDFHKNLEIIFILSIWFPFSYILNYLEEFNKYSKYLKELRLSISSLISYYIYDINKKYITNFPEIKNLGSTKMKISKRGIKLSKKGKMRFLEKRTIRIYDIMEIRNSLLEMNDIIKSLNLNILSFEESFVIKCLEKNLKYNLKLLKNVPKYSNNIGNINYKLSPYFSLNFEGYFEGVLIPWKKINVLSIYKKYYYPNYGGEYEDYILELKNVRTTK